ncbi:MAG: SmdA family multidrug ABC transporter permease/ATP-binding protein [Pantoea sp. Brub]|nr:SmdA family multidrug ABC transporter permease/ATP-binding protein [Pantoea sp. Brub]
MQLFIQLSWYFISEWKRYLGAIILLIIIALMQLIPPYVVGIVIDGVTSRNISTKSIFFWLAFILITAMIIYLLRYIWRILLFGASYKLAIELREKFYRQLSIEQSFFYLKYRTGDLISRAIHDIDRVVFAAGEGVLTLVDSMVMSFIVFITMITKINVYLTLISLIPMPIMALIINRYGYLLNRSFKLAQISLSTINDFVQESLTSIRMIKSFGIEKYKLKQFSTIVNEVSKKNLSVSKVDVLFDPTIYITIGLSHFLAISIGSWLVWNSQMSLGQLTRFIMYLGLMIWPMLALAWMFNIVERGRASWNRIQSLLKDNSININNNNILSNEIGILRIAINNFYYPHTLKPTLNKIKFKLKPGEILGLCGPTGSGKTTLINLIQCYLKIQKGDISYNNLSLKKIDLNSWRRRLAVVNQIPFLFSGTIANNIALGKPNATYQEIQQVAKIACVHDDILLLKNGYDSEVGEKGILLSGGQKQRITIARALLLNHEILILDDSMSSIDSYTEKKILNNLKFWIKEHTLIIISHRLSNFIHANNVIVLHKGEIIQRGNHNLLIQTSGWYKDMYCQQLETALYDNPLYNGEPHV